MSGLHESASWDLTNREAKSKEREKALESLAKVKAHEKSKKGKYVKVDNTTWVFKKEEEKIINK